MTQARQHQLILVYGAGSGFGKSTLATAICHFFKAQQVAHRLVEEHDVLTIPAFAAYVCQVENGRSADTETLFCCCRDYVQELILRLPQIAVLDSILPCWDWLLSADVSSKEIARFSADLGAALRPLTPLLIIVDGDIDRALDRAIANRGREWALNHAEQRTGIRDVTAYRDYLAGLRAVMTGNIDDWWIYDLIRVNTTNQSLQQAVAQVALALRGLA